MGLFTYTAIDRQGQNATGSIPAESRASALDAVMRLGLMPVEIRESAAGAATDAVEPARPRKVPQKAVEAFTRELANLLTGGLSLSRALALLKREAAHPGARFVWTRIHDDVVGGESLAESLAKWPQAFSNVYVAMVRAGEAGGFLHVVLQQIADFRQREQDLKGKIKAAMVYPIALVTIATGVMIFLLTYFIPRFSQIFAQFNSELPLLTQFVVAVSKGLATYGPFLLGALLIGAVALRRSAQTEQGCRRLEQVLLRAPAIGTVTARFALVRFCRMLGTLIGAGVPLIAALRVAREALGNQTLADSITEAIDQVQRGTPLSRALATNTQLFPAGVIEMISVAEETGRLNEELVRLAAAYESDLDRHLRILVALVEPLILLVMAGLIGTIVISMLLPLFTLQDMIK